MRAPQAQASSSPPPRSPPALLPRSASPRSLKIDPPPPASGRYTLRNVHDDPHSALPHPRRGHFPPPKMLWRSSSHHDRHRRRRAEGPVSARQGETNRHLVLPEGSCQTGRRSPSNRPPRNPGGDRHDVPDHPTPPSPTPERRHLLLLCVRSPPPLSRHETP